VLAKTIRRLTVYHQTFTMLQRDKQGGPPLLRNRGQADADW
jgi:hypothetical protein